MKNEPIDSPLKIIQRHEPMLLFKIAAGKQTNRHYIELQYRRFITNKYSRNTCMSYRQHIKTLLNELDQKSPVLTVKIIKKFLTKKGYNYHSAVKSFLKCVEEEFNRRFADFDYPDVYVSEEKAIETLSDTQIYAIINKMPDEFKFFTEFVYLCGLRISEPFRLKVKSINWQKWHEDESKHSLLTISNAKSKRERLIPISPEFTRKILKFIKDEKLHDNFLFDFDSNAILKKEYKKAMRKKIGVFMLYDKDSDLHEYRRIYVVNRYIRKMSRLYQDCFRDISKKVIGKKHTPHILRKSRATAMLKAGVPILSVMHFLGHKDLKTTQKYLSFDIDDLSSNMSKLGL